MLVGSGPFSGRVPAGARRLAINATVSTHAYNFDRPGCLLQERWSYQTYGVTYSSAMVIGTVCQALAGGQWMVRYSDGTEFPLKMVQITVVHPVPPMHAIAWRQARFMPIVIVDGDVDAVEGEDDGELGEQHDSPLDKGWEMVRDVTQDQRTHHGHGDVQTHMKMENPNLAIVFEYWRTNVPMHLFSEWVQVLNETGKKHLASPGGTSPWGN